MSNCIDFSLGKITVGNITRSMALSYFNFELSWSRCVVTEHRNASLDCGLIVVKCKMKFYLTRGFPTQGSLTHEPHRILNFGEIIKALKISGEISLLSSPFLFLLMVLFKGQRNKKKRSVRGKKVFLFIGRRES